LTSLELKLRGDVAAVAAIAWPRFDGRAKEAAVKPPRAVAPVNSFRRDGRNESFWGASPGTMGLLCAAGIAGADGFGANSSISHTVAPIRTSC
jgi:hypothetical protein